MNTSFSRQLGRSGVQVSALAWLWGRTKQTIPIPGFRSVAQVKENCLTTERGAAR